MASFVLIAAATSSSAQCAAGTASTVPWQGSSTGSINGDEVRLNIWHYSFKNICSYLHNRGAASFLDFCQL